MKECMFKKYKETHKNYTKDELEKASSELLPCLYCGSNRYIRCDGEGLTHVMCENKKCFVNIDRCYNWELSNVVKVFNKRVLPDKEE